MSIKNRLPKLRRPRWQVMAVVAGMAMLADAFLSFAYVRFVSDRVPPVHPDVALDAAVVFFAYGSEEGLGPETVRRLEHARSLYALKKVGKIVCVGGARPDEQYYGSEQVKARLISLGVPEHHVYSERRSNDSRSNLIEARKIIDSEAFATVAFVSDSMHGYRLNKMRRELDGFSDIILAPYDYGRLKSISDFGGLWYRVHYEWTALAAGAVVPPALYRKALDIMRHPYVMAEEETR